MIIINQPENFPIGTLIIWHSIPYGDVRGTITSLPYYFNGMKVYDIESFNNNQYKIYFVPHQSYGLTEQLNN
jgi:hypothetical protein